MPLSLECAAHCEEALRTSVAALLAAGVFHLLEAYTFSYLVAVVAVLSSAATTGATLHVCLQAVSATAATVPLNALALSIGRLFQGAPAIAVTLCFVALCNLLVQSVAFSSFIIKLAANMSNPISS